MGSCVMDALDNRKVIATNIPGEFLQGDWQQDDYPGYIMFGGVMVEIICELDLSYYKNVVWSKNCKKKSLYGQLIKAVYGTLLGAIIFYNKVSKHLSDHGFIQNEYDMCTFNKLVNGEQITVKFHVDDLKVSHKNEAVQFGQEDKLTENRRLVHKYLGITIDYSIPCKVVFTMFDYPKDVIHSWG